MRGEQNFPTLMAKVVAFEDFLVQAPNTDKRSLKFPRPLSYAVVKYSPQRQNKVKCLGWVLPNKLGRGVRPASQNPYPIYDQNLRFSLPYL